ncbi:MAG: hypothetical protein IPM99_19330 [Rubrivivax sp.]|nr:hypothetical protein [Rubrivivax sp.]
MDLGKRIAAATVGVDNELTNATEASMGSAATSNMRQVMADIAAMQQRFAAATTDLQRVIEGSVPGTRRSRCA